MKYHYLSNFLISKQEVWIMSEATRIPELFGSLVFK